MENKVVVPGKVKKDKSNPKKYKVKKDKTSESDIDIEVTGDGDYEVEKLSVDGLPDKMPDGSTISWFNNFFIKKNGAVIKEKYYVTIPDPGKSWIVILDSTGEPYYYGGKVKDYTIELTDGDPGIGKSP